FLRSFQLSQTFDGCKYDILLISGTHTFGTDIFDTCQLDYRTSRTSGDNSSTFRSSLQQHLCTAEFTNEVMSDTSILISCNCNQFLHCVFFSFTDCFRNLGSFSKSCTYMSIAISDNN